MARYDPSDEAWAIIQALIPAQPVTSRARCSWAEHHNMIINSMLWDSMVRFTREIRPWKIVLTALTDGRNPEYLTLFSIDLLFRCPRLR